MQTEPHKKTLLGLAPMEGVTDFPVRLWLSLCSAPDFAVTPFLRVTRDYPAKRVPSTFAPESGSLKAFVPYELTPQIMGCEVQDLARIAEHFLEKGGAKRVDFNCGCPSPTVVGHGAGSALLANADTFHAYLFSLSKHLGSDRISVKMRVGFQTAEEFPRLAEVMHRISPSRLTLHGRTRAQKYKGKADWSHLNELRGIQSELVGSGDVCSLSSFLERKRLHPEGPLLIGRGLLRNPFLLRELRTQQTQKISPLELIAMIEVYALLQHLYEVRPEKLLEIVGSEEGLFRTELSPGFEAWLPIRETLVKVCGFPSQDAPRWELARGSFFKVKMLWNSFRTGLPEEFFSNPAPLRQASWGQFLQSLQDIMASLGNARSVDAWIALGHNEHHDWIFSGEQKPHGIRQPDSH